MRFESPEPKQSIPILVHSQIISSLGHLFKGHQDHVSILGNCSQLYVDNDGAFSISVSDSSSNVCASERRIISCKRQRLRGKKFVASSYN